MSKLFFAKMNINADIYDVYNDVKSLDDLLKKVYIGVNNKTLNCNIKLATLVKISKYQCYSIKTFHY